MRVILASSPLRQMKYNSWLYDVDRLQKGRKKCARVYRHLTASFLYESRIYIASKGLR
jgi:hypothetical protein